uniref:Si:dkeyp-101e12.1 n=1 Tax=Macrostomum lignano TaxID=282301 RepID=A0A1I8FMM6_9PLAT
DDSQLLLFSSSSSDSASSRCQAGESHQSMSAARTHCHSAADRKPATPGVRTARNWLLSQLAKQAAGAGSGQQDLVREGLRRSLDEHRYEHIGSEELWRRHREALEEMQQLL